MLGVFDITESFDFELKICNLEFSIFELNHVKNLNRYSK